MVILGCHVALLLLEQWVEGKRSSTARAHFGIRRPAESADSSSLVGLSEFCGLADSYEPPPTSLASLFPVDLCSF